MKYANTNRVLEGLKDQPNLARKLHLLEFLAVLCVEFVRIEHASRKEYPELLRDLRPPCFGHPEAIETIEWGRNDIG